MSILRFFNSLGFRRF